jgi:hypothetical protein
MTHLKKFLGTAHYLSGPIAAYLVFHPAATCSAAGSVSGN